MDEIGDMTPHYYREVEDGRLHRLSALKPMDVRYHRLPLMNSLTDAGYLAFGSIPRVIRPSCTVLIKESD